MRLNRRENAVRVKELWKRFEAPRYEEAAPPGDFGWLLEALAPLRFPLAQGLWLLRPWLGSERIARWVASLEGIPPTQDEKESSP